MTSTLTVATASQGILRSIDDGHTWHRLGLGQPIEFDGVVRCLTPEPNSRRSLYAGADCGLCHSSDGGSNWTLIDSPFVGHTVWKIAIDPTDPGRMFAGTGAPSRAALWRTLDGGHSWTRVGPEIAEFCAGVNRPRLLALAINPREPRKAWFGLEAGGLFHTVDGGTTWERIDQRFKWDYHADVHAVHVLPDPLQTIVVVCVNAIYTSRDGGATWVGMLPKSAFGMYYARALDAPANADGTIYVSIADGTPGTRSKIIFSQDGAQTWKSAEFDQEATSCFWSIRANPDNPGEMLAGTKYGELYTSRDGGRRWSLLPRKFPEITDVLWIPERADIQPAHRSDVA